MIASKELAALARRWGQPRLEETMIHLVQSKDHKGLFILVEPTAEHVEKVMMAIYAPEHVTAEHVEIVGAFA